MGGSNALLFFYFVLVLVGVGVAALLVARFPGLLPTTLVLLLASWIPNIIGVLVTARTDGRAGLSQLFARIVRCRFTWAWYAVALLLPVAAVLLAIGGGALFGAAPPRIITDPGVFLPLFLINVLAGPLGEELGWRGTALPRLLARWGALSSSLVLGVALPLFFTASSQRDMGFGLFLAGTVCTRIILTWLFNSTHGSVLLCTILHQSINTWTDILAPLVPSTDQAINHWLGLGLNSLLVGVLVVIFGATRLAHLASAIEGQTCLLARGYTHRAR